MTVNHKNAAYHRLEIADEHLRLYFGAEPADPVSLRAAEVAYLGAVAS
jgi:hypothetical protein